MNPSEDKQRQQKCYLAGPMRGYPEYNFPAFYAAAKSLRDRGIEVWSPAENDVHADGFDPTKDTAQPMVHYMKRDLPAVLDADFVAVLPGWERSQGASLEVHVARTCGIPVRDAATLAEVSASSSCAAREAPPCVAKGLYSQAEHDEWANPAGGSWPCPKCTWLREQSAVPSPRRSRR